LETSKDDHQIGSLQRLSAGDVGVAGLELSGLLINSEEHGAFESVVLGKDAAQHRQRLLGLVFMIAGDQDDVLALAGSVGAFIDERRGASEAGKEGEQGKEESFHSEE
jgi:hypothetical protein